MQQRTFFVVQMPNALKTTFNHKVDQETKQSILALFICSQDKKTKNKTEWFKLVAGEC